MSKASEWAERLATIACEIDGVIVAGVMLNEKLRKPRLKCFDADLDEAGALAYAHWILETFGEATSESLEPGPIVRERNT
jgi:hypothetical protein